MGRLDAKTCVLTGATKGIGRAIAVAFNREGAELLLVGRDEAAASKLIAHLSVGKERMLLLDLTDAGAASHVAGEAARILGNVDVLVNCAAMDYIAPLLETPAEDLRQVMETNVVAPALLIQAIVPLMRNGGSIVNLTSRLAEVGVSTMSVYGASKGAISALTRGAAIELAPLGLRVNAVAPGLTSTPLTDAWLASQGDPEGARREAEEQIPQGRFATAEEVASAALFLACDDASHITGATIPVDGGYTAA